MRGVESIKLDAVAERHAAQYAEHALQCVRVERHHTLNGVVGAKGLLLPHACGIFGRYRKVWGHGGYANVPAIVDTELRNRIQVFNLLGAFNIADELEFRIGMELPNNNLAVLDFQRSDGAGNTTGGLRLSVALYQNQVLSFSSVRQLGEHGYDLADLVALIGQFGEQGFAC